MNSFLKPKPTKSPADIRLQYAAVREVSQMDSGTLPVDLNGAPPLSVIGLVSSPLVYVDNFTTIPFPYTVARALGSRLRATLAGQPSLFDYAVVEASESSWRCALPAKLATASTCFRLARA